MPTARPTQQYQLKNGLTILIEGDLNAINSYIRSDDNKITLIDLNTATTQVILFEEIYFDYSEERILNPEISDTTGLRPITGEALNIFLLPANN
jgi:hypothetical protein